MRLRVRCYPTLPQCQPITFAYPHDIFVPLWCARGRMKTSSRSRDTKRLKVLALPSWLLHSPYGLPSRGGNRIVDLLIIGRKKGA